MHKLTIKRTNAKDPIHINVWFFNPVTHEGTSTIGLFDTGNDHTVITREVADRIGITAFGRPLSVCGVNGASEGRAAHVTIGIEFDEQHKVTIEEHEVVVLSDASSPLLIGRDFLEMFDVKIGRDGSFTLER